MLPAIVVAVHAGGVEVYDLAGTNASKSTCAKLCTGGAAAALHTSPPRCNQRNYLYIALRVVMWHLQHPTTEWAKPPLRKFAMPRRECRAMFDAAPSWVKVPGNIALRRTGWAPSVRKEFAKVAEEVPPVRGKGPVPFAPIIGNMVPLVVLHQIAPARPHLRLSLIVSLSRTPMPLCPLQG